MIRAAENGPNFSSIYAPSGDGLDGDAEFGQASVAVAVNFLSVSGRRRQLVVKVGDFCQYCSDF